MGMRLVFILLLVCFVGFCAFLIIESGLFENSAVEKQAPLMLLASRTGQDSIIGGEIVAGEAQGAQENAEESLGSGVFDFTTIRAYHSDAKVIRLGSIDPVSGFKFEVELSSRGAAIRKVTLSEHNDRDYRNPQPLVLLSPTFASDGSEILSMANGSLDLGRGQKNPLVLQNLEWESSGVMRERDGSEKIVFETIIKDAGDRECVKLTVSYKVMMDSYHLEYEKTIENLSDVELRPRYYIEGPVGIGREGFRADMRKIMGAFLDSEGQVQTSKVVLKKLEKATGIDKGRLVYKDARAKFIWAATVNKYFAAILRPVPDEGLGEADWVVDKFAKYYDPDKVRDSGDETGGLGFTIGSIEVGAAGEGNSSKALKFQLYLGPKDRNFFEKNELYRQLGFSHTIDFPTCCCPTSIINPLAFGILSLMKWMYGFWPHNYGIVIIILVLLIRLLLHPITKKSQVSMMKFSKLAPKTAEIRKQFAGNQAEAHKRILAYYKEQGVSPFPIMGMLPMMIQMPLWIALWSAINASIDLRGAAFLPFWITDLSVPDALVRFSTVTLPLLGWKIESLNLLPIMMGVAFYLQQKLMPQHAASAAANPQAAQQQKMMMIMFPLMFPLMLYNGPSGVNLYIMASVFAGVFEQHIIRKHIREKEAQEAQVVVSATSKTGGKAKKKKPKPFFRY